MSYQNTESCEQTFAWLSSFKFMMRKMSPRMLEYTLLHLCDLRNRRLVAKLRLRTKGPGCGNSTTRA